MTTIKFGTWDVKIPMFQPIEVIGNAPASIIQDIEFINARTQRNCVKPSEIVDLIHKEIGAYPSGRDNEK